jgi:hypothetical protein
MVKGSMEVNMVRVGTEVMVGMEVTEVMVAVTRIMGHNQILI